MKTKITLLLLVATCFAKQLRFLDEVNNGRVAKTALETASEVYSVINTVKDIADKTGAMKFMGHVGMMIDAAATIVETFGSSKSTTLYDIRHGEGFQKLNASIEFDFSLGYRLGKKNEGFNFFMQDMFEHAHIPENFRESFNHSLKNAKYTKRAQRFCDYNFAFNKDENKKDPEKKDYVNYMNILIYKYFNETQHRSKMNAIIITAEARLKLFPDEFIYKTSEKVVGGIEESDTLHSEFVDRDLTGKEIEAILAYFELTTLNEFCRIANIKIGGLVPN